MAREILTALQPGAVAQDLATLIAFDTSPDGRDHAAAVEWIRQRLESLHFSVEIVRSSAAPLVVATRGASQGSCGSVVLYGHYDVDHVEAGWSTPPFTLTQRNGRWYGLGIADNKGALAARLAALNAVDACPSITWIIQGEEESGSLSLKSWLSMRGLPPARWYLDENGWADPKGSQRILACEISNGQAVPLQSAEADRLHRVLATGWSQRHVESRMLNKHLVPGGCAFQASLKHGDRYLGIGTNDALTQIHAPNESIPELGVVWHARGLVSFLESEACGQL